MFWHLYSLSPSVPYLIFLKFLYKTINATHRDTYRVSIQIRYDTYRMLLKVYNPNLSVSSGVISPLYEDWQLFLWHHVPSSGHFYFKQSGTKPNLAVLRKCKILVRPMDNQWLMVGWSVSVLDGPSINNLISLWNQLKNGQNGTWYLWNRMSSFIPKYFLQNLKNSLVAKRTINGGTLGRPVDSWVAFGDRATIFQQHWFGSQNLATKFGNHLSMATKIGRQY